MKQPQNPMPEAPQPNTASPAAPLLDQARQWLTQGSVGELLGRLSPALQDAGNRLTARYHKLSTTQKVVGGIVLFWGVSRLLGGHTSKHHRKHGPHDQTESADTLNELLHFVNDRVEGYKHAVNESQDGQLRGYYQQLVSQSQQFASQLNGYLRQAGDGPQTSTTLKGKLYRGWMDAKAALTGHDEKAILHSNIYGEEWALKAFKDVLADDNLGGEMRRTVEGQYAQSQETYRRLQQLAARE
jgi:uncharacterized protein (TIGR02284 family)